MAGGEGEGDPPSGLPPVPHQPPEQQQQPPPPPSDEESPPSPSNSNSGNSMSGDGNSGNGDGNDDSTNSSTVTGWPPANLYRCPLHWGLYVVCPFYGTPQEMYTHFSGDYMEHQGYEIERIIIGNEPVLRVWSQYMQTCDSGTNLNEEGIYRLIMRPAHHHLLFFFSAKAAQGTTGMHMVFLGPQQRADRYSCSLTIENRAEVGANSINLHLEAIGTDGWETNILKPNEEHGQFVANLTLKDYCDQDSGNLYFYLELHIPPDEAEDELVI